jgi:hypothetical protein
MKDEKHKLYNLNSLSRNLEMKGRRIKVGSCAGRVGLKSCVFFFLIFLSDFATFMS